MAGPEDGGFEWDPRKSDETKRQRGFGFDIVHQLNWGYACLADIQHHNGEERHLHIVPLNDRLMTIITTQRVNRTRVISLRTATNHEARLWVEEFSDD